MFSIESEQVPMDEILLFGPSKLKNYVLLHPLHLLRLHSISIYHDQLLRLSEKPSWIILLKVDPFLDRVKS